MGRNFLKLGCVTYSKLNTLSGLRKKTECVVKTHDRSETFILQGNISRPSHKKFHFKRSILFYFEQEQELLHHIYEFFTF
jgi:hypothetical protein